MSFMTLAAEGGNPVAFQLVPYFTTLVIFLVAAFVLVTKVWPKILSGLDERNEKILGEIKNAEQARADAEAAKAEFERSLAEARREAQEMISKAREDARAAADELKARNERELGEMKQRATREIESAKQDAVAALHAEAATLATAVAAKILQREISVDDQQRLVEESLQELGSARSN